MRKIVINGIHLSTSSSINGIPRYCREIILRLDKICADHLLDIEYAYLSGANNVVLPLSELHHIKPVCITAKSWKKATLVDLPCYIRKQKAIGVCFSPEPLLSKRHIAAIHDLRAAVFRQYDSWHFRLSYRFILYTIKYCAKTIVTVSDFQKKAIKEYFKIKNQKDIVTIFPGWEHLQNIDADDGIFRKYPILLQKKFYYAIGSLAPHKNFQWILEVAKRNSNLFFAIAGGKDLRNWKDNIQTDEYSNVIFLGYVSDAENKALMQKCQAFLHPAKYEGFGLPPLEALACGAPVIISNSTCLPEIYEDCAHYIDPDNYDVDLERLMSEKVALPDKILSKYSWDKSAQKWYDLILEAASN